MHADHYIFLEGVIHLVSVLDKYIHGRYGFVTFPFLGRALLVGCWLCLALRFSQLSLPHNVETGFEVCKRDPCSYNDLLGFDAGPWHNRLYAHR